MRLFSCFNQENATMLKGLVSFYLQSKTQTQGPIFEQLQNGLEVQKQFFFLVYNFFIIETKKGAESITMYWIKSY